ncbi:hypothetical protein [Allorhodopirellula heiligendammensis]|uniref:hypothetical protein n=1 Tax=Allorhodopirellula heiligendammensis TaxID=2714739 RepID=UPI00265F8112|nr:hypothetical protein [Allorhodopirellula heiligendammensis]
MVDSDSFLVGLPVGRLDAGEPGFGMNFALLVDVIRHGFVFLATRSSRPASCPPLNPLPSISMVPFRFRIQFVVLLFALSHLVVSVGCQPPRGQAITTEDGEVATDFSADMIDDGTPVTEGAPVADDQATAEGDAASAK